MYGYVILTITKLLFDVLYILKVNKNIFHDFIL